MKFPYLTALGKDDGWYRVGPLARVNNCDYIDTPLAEAARVEFKQHGGGAMVHSTLAFHWARLIEVLHCAESIKCLLHDPDIMSSDLVAQGEKRYRGIGVIEAPRGTLFHDYQIDENDIVTKANLIVSTTSNNMGRGVPTFAKAHFGHPSPSSRQKLNGTDYNLRCPDSPCVHS